MALTWRATGGISIGALQALQIMLAVLAWIPTAVLGHHCLRSHAVDRCELALLGVSLWGLAEILAIIAMRPEFRLWFPISRYMEILGIAAFANIGCLLRAAHSMPALRGLSRWTLPAFACAITFGTPFAAYWYEWRAENLTAQAQRVARYVKSSDATVWTTAPVAELPFPSPDYLRAQLDAPDVRYILGDIYGSRLRPARLSARWRSVLSFLRAGQLLIWPAAALLAWLLLPPAWRRTRYATIPE